MCLDSSRGHFLNLARRVDSRQDCSLCTHRLSDLSLLDVHDVHDNTALEHGGEALVGVDEGRMMERKDESMTFGVLVIVI